MRPTKKGRAIVEVDTDRNYVMSGNKLEESSKVKTFVKFVEDLKLIAKERSSNGNNDGSLEQYSQ